ncbi:MAG: hypothetical protein AAGE18_19690 [Pseudomonadota bacterium]
MSQTALPEYARLEAVGTWVEGPEAPAEEVVVKLGTATLTLVALDDAPLIHLSIAGLVEISRDDHGRTYAPDVDAAERLTLGDPTMLAALDAVRRASVPPVRRGRGLGWGTVLLLILLIGGAVAVWSQQDVIAEGLIAALPEDALTRLDEAILARAYADAGAEACRLEPAAAAGLARIRQRLGLSDAARLHLLRQPDEVAAVLPGGGLVLGAGLIRRAGGPEEVAGLLTLLDAGPARAREEAALARELGLFGSLRQLSGAPLPEGMLRRRARMLTNGRLADLADGPAVTATIPILAAADLPTGPLANLLARQGAAPGPVAALRSGDRVGGNAFEPALPDQAWVALQNACTG